MKIESIVFSGLQLSRGHPRLKETNLHGDKKKLSVVMADWLRKCTLSTCPSQSMSSHCMVWAT